MFSQEENVKLLISSIKDKIESWKRFADGSIVIKPKKASFDELCVSFRKIFLDTEYIFVSNKTVARISKTKYSRLDEKIGNISLELKWVRKLFLKKPIFAKSENSSNLQVVDAILNSLNSEKELFEKIRKCSPENLNINLVPLTPPNNPKSINLSWIISLNKVLYRQVSYPRKIRTIFDILDSLSKILGEASIQLIQLIKLIK